MLLGKTFSFTPDEANVENMVRACDLTINLFCLLRILTLCHIYHHCCYGLFGDTNYINGRFCLMC